MTTPFTCNCQSCSAGRAGKAAKGVKRLEDALQTILEHEEEDDAESWTAEQCREALGIEFRRIDCDYCGGSGGGPDPALRCPWCKGSGVFKAQHDDDGRADYERDRWRDGDGGGA